MANSLRIGALIREKMQQHALQTLIKECGHEMAECVLQSELKSSSPQKSVDAWIVLTNEDTSGDGLEATSSTDSFIVAWLDDLEVPAIICDAIDKPVGSAEFAAWSRRLKGKLTHIEGTINLGRDEIKRAHEVWVLAASTGGPAVVKEFLSELPLGLDVGFIYVQHINRGFDVTLAHTISKHSHYPAYLVKNGDIVCNHQVAIVPPDRATEILGNGTFEVKETPWQAPYSPSVDCVVASVACAYPQHCGVIIFTGMGDDGAASARIMHQKGGQVWVQTPGSCISDSMPQAAIAQGCVDFKGSPYALAQQFVKSAQQRKHARYSRPGVTQKDVAPIRKAAS